MTNTTHPTYRILLVAKQSKINAMSADILQRLDNIQSVTTERMRQSHRMHTATLDSVRQTLAGHHICERRVDELHASDFIDIDLVVTVGGDGSVLAVNGFVVGVSVLAVNSDPERSVGNYTRCNKHTFAALWEQWLDGRAAIDIIPRLSLEFAENNEQYCILNDCLLTNHNPAAMTRYIIEVDGKSERQSSSGVWISTGAGSTGAIHSSGMSPVSSTAPALLYKIREPFRLRDDIHMLEGCQLPPRRLTLTPIIDGIHIYIDGAHQYKRIQIGSPVTFSRCTAPLHLVMSDS